MPLQIKRVGRVFKKTSTRECSRIVYAAPTAKNGPVFPGFTANWPRFPLIPLLDYKNPRSLGKDAGRAHLLHCRASLNFSSCLSWMRKGGLTMRWNSHVYVGSTRQVTRYNKLHSLFKIRSKRGLSMKRLMELAFTATGVPNRGHHWVFAGVHHFVDQSPTVNDWHNAE